jgi:hypothetical protein
LTYSICLSWKKNDRKSMFSQSPGNLVLFPKYFNEKKYMTTMR